MRVQFNDTANEKKIVAEHYEPLQGFPEKFKNFFKSSKSNKSEAAQKKIDLTLEERAELKEAINDLIIFNKEQENLVLKGNIYGDEAANLKKEWEDLKKEIKFALEDAQEKYENMNPDDLNPQDKQLFEMLVEGVETFEKRNEKYFSGIPQGKKTYHNGSKDIIRSEKDIRKNIETVVTSGKDIPKEHLVRYLKNLFVNKDYYKQVEDNGRGSSKDIYLKNPTLNNDVDTAQNILKLYDKLSEGKRLELRNQLDSQLMKELPNNKKIKDLMKKEKLSKEEILLMAEELKSLKKKIYKNIMGEENLDFKIKFVPPMETHQVGGAGMTKDTLMMFFEADNVTPDFVLETLIHEMIHNEQNSMIESNDERVGIFKDLYYLNTKKSGYFKNNGDVYINQPVEKEAIIGEKIIGKYYKEALKRMESQDSDSSSDNNGDISPDVFLNNETGIKNINESERDRENEQTLFKKGIFSKNKEKDKPQKQSKVKFGNGDKMIIRSEKEIRDNLKKIADAAENIPEEHLINYLNNTLRNENFVQTVKKVKEKSSRNNVVVKVPVLNNDVTTERNINKILQKVYNQEDTSVRKDMDNKLFDRLAENEKIVELLKQNELSKEELGEMISTLAKIKKDIYKEVLGEEMESFKVEVHRYDPLYEGGYKNGVISLYRNPKESPLATLKTLIHEMTHAEQHSMEKSKNEKLGNLPEIYKANSADSGYILKSREDYYTQPIEKEAHRAEWSIGKKLENKLKNESILSDKLNPNKYDILDKDNPFDFPQDNGVTIQIKDNANEEIIIPEYYNPLKVLPPSKKVEEKTLEIDKEQEEYLLYLKKLSQYLVDNTNDGKVNVKYLKDLEAERDRILNVFKEVAEKNNLERVSVTPEQIKILETIDENLIKYQHNLEKNYPNQFPKSKPQRNKKYKDNVNVIFRGDNDIKNNLKKVAENADKIPREHLINYLENVIDNREYKEIVDTDPRNVSIPVNRPITHDISSEKDLLKIYENILKDTDNSVRNTLNIGLINKLSNSPQLKNIIKKGKVNEEILLEMGNLVQKYKKEVFEELYGEPYQELPIKISPPRTDEVMFGINDGKSIIIYYDKDNNLTGQDALKNYLTVIVHETTHQDQNNIAQSKGDKFGMLTPVYHLNVRQGGYAKRDYENYKNQPREADAYASEHVVQKFFDEILNKNGIISNNYKKHEEGDVNLFNKNKFKKKNNKGNDTSERLETNSRGEKVFIRNSKDIKNNLKLVAENADSIPAEHLSVYLGKTLMNNETATSKNKNFVTVKKPEISHSTKSAEDLVKIYNSIYERDSSNMREQLNNKFLENIQSNSEIIKILKENKVTPKNIKNLADLVGKEKAKSFKELTGKSYDTANVIVKGAHPTDNGRLSGNTLILYTNKDRDIIDMFGTILHEYTHNDQRNQQEFEYNENGSQLPYLYNINKSKSGYINPEVSIEGYKNQPLEKEAYDIQKKVIKQYRDEQNLSSLVKDENDNTNGTVLYGKDKDKRSYYEKLGAKPKRNQSFREKVQNSFKKSSEKNIEKAEVLQMGTNSKVIIRNEKEIRKNLKLVNKMADKIPKEHLIDYLKNTITNKGFNDTLIQTRQESSDVSKSPERILIKVPVLENNIATEKTLGQIYDKLYKNEDKTIREELNKDFLDNLEQNEIIKQFLKKENLSKNEVEEMANEVVKIKKQVYEKRLGENYRDVIIAIEDYNSKLKGSYNRKTGHLTLYHRPAENPLLTLQTIAHELTHTDQHSMIDTKNEEVDSLANIYYVNTAMGGYIEKDYQSYRNQPMEKEAHDIEDEIKRRLSVKKKNLEQNSKKVNKEVKEVVDLVLSQKVKELKSKDIISGISDEDLNKLSLQEKKEALELLKDFEELSENGGGSSSLNNLDKIITAMENFANKMEEKYSEPEKEKKLEIQHFPSKNTKNIEDPYLPAFPKFSDNTLIYGASGEDHEGTPRDEMVDIIKASRDIPLVADIFLYTLDVSNEIQSYKTFNPINKETENFIKEVIEKNGEISEETLNKLLNPEVYDYYDSYSFHADKVNHNSEKELIKELLEDKEFKENLKEIYDLNLKLKTLREKLENKNLSDYDKIYLERQVDNVVDGIYDIFPIINLAKTKKILDKVLGNNGKIYFSLDGIATSKDENGKLMLDRKKLSDILFNKNSKYYNSMTSQELRYIYDKHLDKPGLKFMIDGQVISIPTPERNKSKN